MADSFRSSKNKDVIRSTYDKNLVRAEFEHHDVPLTYFGLPGWRLLDVINWQEYLKAYVAFEEKPLLGEMMLLTAFRHRIESGLTLFEEEIDQALVNNKSRDGRPIPFGFEVANMDYEGGIVYKDIKENSKRVNALQALFAGQQQEKKDFLLLLTVNVRKNDKGEIDIVVERILKDNGITRKETLNTIPSQPVASKYKVYVSHLIKRVAEANHFDCHIHSPVRYSGVEGKSVMVHFAFTLRFNRKISAISPSKQTMAEVLSLEMLEAREGRIQVEGVKFP